MAVIKNKAYYKKVLSGYQDVTEEKPFRQVLIANGTPKADLDAVQRMFVSNIFSDQKEYIDRLRVVQVSIRKDIKDLAENELTNAQVSLITSIILLTCIAFLAPIILVFNRNIAVMGQVLKQLKSIIALLKN